MTKLRVLLVTTILFLTVGCATGSTVRADDTDNAATDGPKAEGVVTYTLDASERASGTVAFRVDIPDAGAGPTTFVIPREWGGLSNIPGLIRDVRATDGSGSALQVRQPKPTHWVVDHPDGANVRFHYRLVSSTPEGQTSPTAMLFTPRIDGDEVFALGTVSLVQPKGLEGLPEPTYAFRWKGVPDKWKTATSFTTERRGRVGDSFRDLQRSLFYAGADLRVLQREVRERPVYMAISGSWDFEDAALMEIVTRILEAERNFFDDHDQPYFLVSVVPVTLQGTPLEGSDLASGTGLYQSFVSFLVPDQTSLQDAKAFKVEHLLAHELFHNWNGTELIRTPEEREATVYWFTEGFTEHFTREILLDAGLIDRERYLENLNEQIAAYHTNPLRNATNDKLARRFWKSKNGRRLAYQRGALVALRIDHRIRQQSNGQKSLADLMRHLHRTAPSSEKHPNERIFEAVATFTSEEYANSVRKLVLEGGTVELPSTFPEPCARLAENEKTTHTFGFAIEKSLTSSTVRGVEPDSPAARAGLENGQTVVGFEKFRDDEGVGLELTVETEDGEKARRVRPTVQTVRVPKYDLLSAEKCEGSGEGSSAHSPFGFGSQARWPSLSAISTQELPSGQYPSPQASASPQADSLPQMSRHRAGPP